MKECDIFREVKAYSDPPTYFQMVRTPATPGSTHLLYNHNPNVTWSELPQNSNGFFRGPCATFHRILSKSVESFLRNSAKNKLTN